MDERPVDSSGHRIETPRSLRNEGWLRFGLWVAAAAAMWVLSTIYLDASPTMLGPTVAHYLPALIGFLLLGLPWKSEYVARKLRDDVVAPWVVLFMFGLLRTSFAEEALAQHGQLLDNLYMVFAVYMWIGLVRAVLAMFFDRHVTASDTKVEHLADK